MTTQISQQANLFIAMDISQSMWAEDILPSRMQFAIDFSQKLLDQLPQVKVALYPFALDGYMMMPLSTDIQAAKDLLSAMTPSIATGQGTDLGGMLTHLLEQIQKAEKTAKSRGSQWVTPQVLLISDGESHVQVPNSVPLSFRAASIPIFTIGVGGSKPVTIPVQSRFGNRAPLRDTSEKLAMTSSHPEILQKISELSDGLYYPGSFSEIPKVVSRLNQSLQLGKLSTQFKLTREFYPYCFLLSFLFLFAEFCFMRWEFAIRFFP
ncbi:MAG: vWA domain-containing protein, partial [Deltaproteobacteria bacterium]